MASHPNPTAFGVTARQGCEYPGNSQIAEEWDKNAEARHNQIKSGKDLSRDQVIIPAMIATLEGTGQGRLLDIGTGDGEFVSRLQQAGIAATYVGIDISPNMVKLARSQCSGSTAEFLVLEAERSAKHFGKESFDIATANMVFNTAPNIESVIRGVSDALKPGGVFVFSMIHPTFFYLQMPWAKFLPRGFDVRKPTRMRFTFTISLDLRPLPSPVTLFHRPISTYLELLAENGLSVTNFVEPLPDAKLDVAYLRNWKLPRFLIMKTRKPNVR